MHPRNTHPIHPPSHNNIPYQCTLVTHTIFTHPLNPPYQPPLPGSSLPTALIDPESQPALLVKLTVQLVDNLSGLLTLLNKVSSKA